MSFFFLTSYRRCLLCFAFFLISYSAGATQTFLSGEHTSEDAISYADTQLALTEVEVGTDILDGYRPYKEEELLICGYARMYLTSLQFEAVRHDLLKMYFSASDLLSGEEMKAFIYGYCRPEISSHGLDALFPFYLTGFYVLNRNQYPLECLEFIEFLELSRVLDIRDNLLFEEDSLPFELLPRKEKEFVIAGYSRRYLASDQLISIDPFLDKMFFEPISKLTHEQLVILIHGYCRPSFNGHGIDAAIPFGVLLSFAFVAHLKAERQDYLLSRVRREKELKEQIRYSITTVDFDYQHAISDSLSIDPNNSLRVIHKKNKPIIVKIDTDRLVAPIDRIVYDADKELLLYGFLRTRGPNFYIPDVLLQMCIEYIHDEAVKEQDDQMEIYIKQCINELEQDIVGVRQNKEEMRCDVFAVKVIAGGLCFLNVVNLAWLGINVYSLAEGGDPTFPSIFIGISGIFFVTELSCFLGYFFCCE